MGELDKKQKVYFEDPRKFADVWNALVYEGEQVVSWEGLRECSPVLVHAEGEVTEERTPDVCMKETADGEMLAILILENQKEVDYGMAARVFLEEAMAYERQARGIRRRNRELYEKTKNAGRGRICTGSGRRTGSVRYPRWCCTGTTRSGTGQGRSMN